MLIVTGYMYIAPALIAAFVRDLQSLAIAARRREDNISYGAAVDDPLAGRLLIAERWRDQAALTAHLHASETVAFLARWDKLFRGGILKYDALRERDLMEA